MSKQAVKTLEVSVPEMRSFGIADLRAADEGSFIIGHPVVYGQKTSVCDLFHEVIERGALDNCDFGDVVFSINHDGRRIPLARSRRNNSGSTMQVGVDEKGLFIKADMDIENNADAKSLYSAVKREDVSGMSFVFFIGEERWEGLDTDMPVRHIQRISKILEVSAVNHPAYDGTDINARGTFMLDNAAKVLEHARIKPEDPEKQIEMEKLKTQILMKG